MFTSSMTSSVISPKLIVLKVRANNYEWLYCDLSFLSKGDTTCLKLSIFGNSCQFTKIYVTNFVKSWFCWIVESSFNGIKHIYIQIFVQVDPHVDYIGITIQKIILYWFLRWRTNYIRLDNLNIKRKLPKQNFHGLLFLSKWSFICCRSFIYLL